VARAGAAVRQPGSRFRKRVEYLKSFSAMSLKELIDFIRMKSRKSFGCVDI